MLCPFTGFSNSGQWYFASLDAYTGSLYIECLPNEESLITNPRPAVFVQFAADDHHQLSPTPPLNSGIASTFYETQPSCDQNSSRPENPFRLSPKNHPSCLARECGPKPSEGKCYDTALPESTQLISRLLQRYPLLRRWSSSRPIHPPLRRRARQAL